MEYVQILRSQRVLLWYAGILLSLLLLVVFSIYAGSHGELETGAGGGPHLSHLLQGCMLGAFIVATCVAPGLFGAESTTTPIIWTRPMARDAIAWRYVAVDLLTIAVSYVIALVVCLLFLASFGALRLVTVDAASPVIAVMSLGCAFMAYALMGLVQARLPGHAARMVTLMWAAFLIVGALWAVPTAPPVHALITALNYLNPLAWGDCISVGHLGTTRHPIELAAGVRAAFAWLIGAVAIVAAVRLWSTREI